MPTFAQEKSARETKSSTSYPENDERHKGIERDTCVNRGRRDLLWSTKEMQKGKNTDEMETNR